VILAFDAEPPLEDAERDAPVCAPPVLVPSPPVASGVVSGVAVVGAVVVVGGVVVVVVVSHVCAGSGATVVDVVVDVVDEVVVDVVVEVASSGVVSTGIVSATVVDVVVEAGVVVDGTVGFVQSLTTSPDDKALGLVELLVCWRLAVGVVEDVDAAAAVADADGVTLELVWPSMRCSTGNVDDNCTVPSMRSVVVRSPLVTAAVLKIDGVAMADVDFGLRTAIATAPAPATAMHPTIMAMDRPRRRLGVVGISVASQCFGRWQASSARSRVQTGDGTNR